MSLTARAILPLIPLTLLVGSLGCNRKVGPPNDQDELMRPENVASFDRLYKQNCSACHVENGSGGPALDLANPNYQALVDDASLKRWITSGMPGTQMPAFGESAGGFLTPQQVDVLVADMRARWSHKDHTTADMPPYSSSAPGNVEPNVEDGQDIFKVSCLSCHQQGQQKITDASYLALVSDQSLRTIVIAGRPDLGHPDWKQVRHGQPLTDQDVSNVIAYLHSLRSDTPGQPYPETSIRR
jgi:cytochrome c oxidase cbb3-type subunit 3